MIRMLFILAGGLFVACPKTETGNSMAPQAQNVNTENLVNKSPIDHRSYEAIVLENGLKVLIISDPETDMAAASLDVHIGQFSDPWDRQGLAHFLEHMLFMGTEKYPEVDDYRKFIQGHGGRSNAGTSQEHTRYYFSIDQEHLDPALDRFAQFFISPKLDPAYVQRERKAVNSEYSLKIKEDARRSREIRRKTANQAHPFSKFSVGNLETLADRENAPVWDDLRRFYDAEYSASRMSLAVIGREDLSALRTMVERKFSQVPSNGKVSNAQNTENPLPYLAEQLGVQINIEPMAELRTLELQFPLPPTIPHYRERPGSLLTHLIGDEGEGSLFSYLKQQGWVESLSTGDRGSDDHMLMSVRIGLTKAGLASYHQVVDSFFEYVRLLSEEQDLSRYFEEKKQIATLNFRFAEPPKAVSAVQSASRLMHYYPQKHVVDFYSVYGDYNDALVRTYLAGLVPTNMRLMLTAKGLETDKVEPLYNAPYAMRPLDTELLTRWATRSTNPAMFLPAQNPYIAKLTELKVGSITKTPTLLKESQGLQIWHMLDTSFEVPRANVRVSLYSPLVSQSLRNRACNTLYSVLLSDSLTEFSYPLRLAGMSVSVSSSWKGLQLKIGGYDEKQQELLAELSRRVREFTIDPERFSLERARLVRNLRNQKTARPATQAIRKMWERLDPMYLSPYETADTMEQLSAADVQQFIDQWFTSVSLQMLVHGNHTAADVNRLAKVAEQAFLVDATRIDWPGRDVRRIPAEELVEDISIDHQDSVFVAAYQGAESTHTAQAQYRLLAELVRTDFFTELRTNQQLGYLVSASYSKLDRVPGIRMVIQSSTAGPKVLQQRIDTFIVNQKEKLTAMTDADFQTIKQGLIAKLEEKDSSLSNRTSRFLSNLSQGYTTFDHKQQLVAELKLLELATMLELYDKVFLSKRSGRLLIRSTGSAHLDEAPENSCAGESCVRKKLTGMIRR